MYISCNTAFTLVSTDHLSCSGSISDYADLSAVSGFIASCSIPFENEYSSLRCKGDMFSTSDYSVLTDGYSLFQLDYYDGIDNQYYDPPQFYNVTGLSNELIDITPTEPTETVEPSTSETSILDLTSAEYDELSSFFVVSMLLAFGIRMVKKMFIKG